MVRAARANVAAELALARQARRCRRKRGYIEALQQRQHRAAHPVPAGGVASSGARAATAAARRCSGRRPRPRTNHTPRPISSGRGQQQRPGRTPEHAARQVPALRQWLGQLQHQAAFARTLLNAPVHASDAARVEALRARRQTRVGASAECRRRRRRPSCSTRRGLSGSAAGRWPRASSSRSSLDCATSRAAAWARCVEPSARVARGRSSPPARRAQPTAAEPTGQARAQQGQGARSCRFGQVAGTAHGDDERGIELAPQVVHMHFDGVGLHLLAPAVDALFRLLAAEHAPALCASSCNRANSRGERSTAASRQCTVCAAASRRSSPSASTALAWPAPRHQGAQARDQLVQIHRLDHGVVVSAGVGTCTRSATRRAVRINTGVVSPAARRRRSRSRPDSRGRPRSSTTAAKGSAHGAASAARPSRTSHGVAALAQTTGQGVAEQGIILDDERAHGGFRSCALSRWRRAASIVVAIAVAAAGVGGETATPPRRRCLRRARRARRRWVASP